MYLYDKPTTFYEYLSEYALLDGSILIKKGPAFGVCKGSRTGQHKFFKFEGTHTCSTCACIVCCFCCITENNDTKWLGCLHAAVFGISNVSESEMKETLSSYNLMVPTMATYGDMMILYNEVMDGHVVKAFHKHMEEVCFQKCPSIFFDNCCHHL